MVDTYQIGSVHWRETSHRQKVTMTVSASKKQFVIEKNGSPFLRLKNMISFTKLKATKTRYGKRFECEAKFEEQQVGLFLSKAYIMAILGVFQGPLACHSQSDPFYG
jgi:hypothetical protein